MWVGIVPVEPCIEIGRTCTGNGRGSMYNYAYGSEGVCIEIKRS